MKIITVSNIKGGSAKTTTSIFLAQALSRRGKVLVIDLDMQADTTDFFLPDSSPEALDRGNVFRLLTGDCDFCTAIHKGKYLDIIPGTIDLAQFSIRVMQSYSILKKLEQLLLENARYDYVVIDTPGSARSELTVSLIASDTIVIPVTPSKWAVRAVNLLLDEIHSSRDITRKNHRIYFAPSMFGNSQKHLDLLNRLRSLDDFTTLSPIPKSEAIKTNAEKGKNLKPGTAAWESFDRIAEEISKH